MSNHLTESALAQECYSQLVKGLSTKSFSELFAVNPYFCHEQQKSRQLKIITELLDNQQLTIDSQDPLGATLLMWASQVGHLEVVELLLQRKANPNITDKQDETALFKAVFYNRPDIAKLLLSKGADAEKKNVLGTTAFDFAVFNHCQRNVNQLEIIKVLLEHQAPAQIVDNQTKIKSVHLLNTALQRGKYQLYSLLLKQHQQLYPEDHYLKLYFSQLMPKDDPRAIDYLLKNDPNFLMQHPDSVNKAVEKGCMDMAERMLALSTPATRKQLISSENLSGHTALLETLVQNNAGCASVLLAYGDDIATLDTEKGKRLLAEKMTDPAWRHMLKDYAKTVETLKLNETPTLLKKAARMVYQYDQEKKVSLKDSVLPDEVVELIKNTPVILDLQARYRLSEQGKTLLENCLKNAEIPQRARGWRNA